VFKGTVNRMINGYLLRDVINKVNGIHFTSSDDCVGSWPRRRRSR
jgi:type I restriction enzyme M protein